ncbi:hypothetical protein SEA_SATIS_137 [Streptomyces phage Satis]|nr:hypothetical protein SEA_SATIS_137 [Streptomyces phage Satis]QBZ72035.1 hypothetical protein SEA_KRADAL_137 [Streptomyces phage Kradal]QPL14455.1 hypothetical protein SEA_EHYELIMAYOE_138 [Streptomyces phage EhyElimayoE]
MSAAILFYGYSLGVPDDGDWALKNLDEFEPDWLTEYEADAEAEADGEGYEYHMRRAILLASGVKDEEITRENAEALLKEQYLEVISFGHRNTLFYGLALTGSVYRADDWSPQCIRPDFEWNPNLNIPGVDMPDNGPLYNALRDLSMEPVQERPSWILAPEEH